MRLNSVSLTPGPAGATGAQGPIGLTGPQGTAGLTPDTSIFAKKTYVTSAVPTNTNQLTNGAAFITASSLSPYALTSSLPVITSATLFTQTATKTVSATTTETSLLSTGTGTSSLPANPVSGKQYRLWIRGVYSTPAVSVATILVKIKIGGTTVASATITGLSISAANYDFEGSTTFTVRTTGATGTIMTTGNIIYSAGANVAYPHIALNNGLSAATVDLTTTNSIDCTVTYSLAVGGNSISALNVSLEQLN